jgi:hypothetical protein
MSQPLLKTSIKSLKLIHQGKVRDIYAIDDATMLLVSTDRLSAFDVILPTGFANKPPNRHRARVCGEQPCRPHPAWFAGRCCQAIKSIAD